MEYYYFYYFTYLSFLMVFLPDPPLAPLGRPRRLHLVMVCCKEKPNITFNHTASSRGEGQ